ncbi:MAG TPA: nucleotidyl transferase AbiEii/AbiGii toxin family protein [bacterium]|nr:nucleotidyl transferase AbiEii/AbiGii toxin family protein [bacterium]
MNLLFAAAADICKFFDSKGWNYCVIGGLALQRWGEPRTTLDVDLTLLTQFGNEQKYIDAILANYESRVADAPAFALRNRILLIKAKNGKDVDVALGGLPFEEEMIARAAPFTFAEGVTLRTCSADDLFIMKIFAGRPKDIGDAEWIAVRQKLDAAYITRHLEFLLDAKGASEMMDIARKLLRGRS